MNKVIICGLRDIETLRAIEYFLDDNYQITGYCDIYPPHINICKSEKIYSLDQLKTLSFDYIVLASFNHQHLSEMIGGLNIFGYNKNVIIPYILRPYSPEKTQEDMVRKINDSQEKFFGIILGLSYSLTGIDKETLSQKFFDFSWRGQDMYYNFQLLKYAFKIGKFTEVKQALLVFPYYYFDYDQSRSYAQYESGQIFGVHALNDWHNAYKIKKNYSMVANYIINYRMFGRKISDYYNYKNVAKNYSVYQGEYNAGTLPKGFFRDFLETEEENRIVFQKIIKILVEHQIVPILIIPPLFIEALNNESYNRLGIIKDKFYSMVRNEIDKLGVNLYVYDFSQIFPNNRLLFRDVEHLNAKGGVVFANVINNQVLEDEFSPLHN